MGIYTAQRGYFRQAYLEGEHGWPVEGPSEPVVRFVGRFKKEHPTGRVLDIGCGEGRHTFLFAENGYAAVGLDYQPLAVARAREIAKRCGVRLPFCARRRFPPSLPGELFRRYVGLRLPSSREKVRLRTLSSKRSPPPG